MALYHTMNCSTPGLHNTAHQYIILHYVPEFPQTHVHWVSNVIQPSHLLSSPSPLALNLSQHQSFPMSWLFASGAQSIGASASASVLLMNIQYWFPLGLTVLISLQSTGLSGVFSTTIWKHQFFGAQPSIWSSSFFMVQLSYPYMTTGKIKLELWQCGPLLAK